MATKQQEVKCPEHDMYILHAASVSSVTLLRNWTDTCGQQLEAAMVRVAEQNPLLLGALVPDPEAGEGRVKIVASQHAKIPITFTDGPHDAVVPAELTDALALAHQLDSGLPVMPSGAALLASGEPIASAAVLVLPGNHALLKVNVCHMLVDGMAYYRLLGQIAAVCQGKEPPTTIWRPSPRIVPTPAHFSDETEAALLTSWLPEFMRRVTTMPPRKPSVLIANTSAIVDLKREFLAEAEASGAPVEFLSTNDLVQAAFSEVSNATMSGMFANMRGRTEFKFCLKFGMNFERCVYHHRAAVAGNPAAVRRLLSTNFVYYDDDTLKPDFAALKKMDFCIVTNWASLTQFCTPGETGVVAHTPPTSVVTAMPFDLGVVFRADASGTTGLLCNFDFSEPGLQQRVQDSRIFKRLFRAPGLSSRVTKPAAVDYTDQ